MLQCRTKLVAVLMLGCVAALAAGGFVMKAAGQNTKESKTAIPAEQVIASIKTAVAAQPGNVRAVEVESERGQTICEVEIHAQDGKTYEVEVDVVTNTVIEVEAHHERDEEKDGQDTWASESLYRKDF